MLDNNFFPIFYRKQLAGQALQATSSVVRPLVRGQDHHDDEDGVDVVGLDDYHPGKALKGQVGAWQSATLLPIICKLLQTGSRLAQ